MSSHEVVDCSKEERAFLAKLDTWLNHDCHPEHTKRVFLVGAINFMTITAEVATSIKF